MTFDGRGSSAGTTDEQGSDFARLLDMSGSGISALIRIGAWLEHEFDSIEVIEIGRPATAPEQDFTMQVCGRFLFYTIALYGPQIHLSAQPMDTGAAPDLLLRTGDNENGWQTVRGVIAALERHENPIVRAPDRSGGRRSRRCQRLGDRIRKARGNASTLLVKCFSEMVQRSRRIRAWSRL